MGYFAELDGGNIVVRVLATDDRMEDLGHSWLVRRLGGKWVQTSYDGSLRKNYAGKGFTYDSMRDAFIPPTPYPSWVLDEATCLWVAPIDYPADGGQYVWDEETTNWVEVN